MAKACLITSALVLLGAHGFENIGGLEPCPLCMNQRGIHWLGIWGGFAVLFGTSKLPNIPAWLFVAALALIYLSSAGVAGYHAGVEWKWWPGPQGCSGGASLEGLTAEELMKSITQASGVARCDEIPWSLFGLSMAGYNFLISLALSALALLGLRSEMQKADS